MRTIRPFLSILLATLWISGSEFLRNEILLKSYWTNHYKGMGLIFPSDPINGVMWGVWSFLFAITIFILSRKFSLAQTTFLSWFVAFVLMWVVLGNMNLLPFDLLRLAIPLSLLEAFLASLIIKSFEVTNTDVK
ncbi:MAG: hypothetical protein IPH45_07670 [Bacteroidales bacterium]|nr:hypothetical protein [Bacteroidales bacterium]MBK7172770.1 hypothetical protein [Bacteroidales bacterium]